MSEGDAATIAKNELRGERAKDVYVWFGAAYYYSEVLHRQLANMFALRIRAATDLMIRPRIEEELRRAFDMTLGQLVAGTQDLVDEEHLDALQEAVQRRNFLAHHFWYDRAHLLASTDGMALVIKELQGHAEFFNQIDERVTSAFEQRMPDVGFPKEQFDEALAEVLAGKPADPLPNKRYLRKTEKIARALIPDVGNPAYFIFETDDGMLWQLADLGLAWSPYDAAGSEWTMHPLQACLPATCVPRPLDAKPWDYTLRLENRGLVRVRRDSKSGRVLVATKVLLSLSEDGSHRGTPLGSGKKRDEHAR